MDKQEAIKILKEFHDTSALFSVRTALETVFPELKENEDEKVRKELITHCRNIRCVTEEGAESIAKWIAWLEKQGEHKDYYTKQELIDMGFSFTLNGDIVTPDEMMDDMKKYLAWKEKQGEPIDDNIITRDDEILQAISIGLTDAVENFGWSNFGGLPIKEIQEWLEKQGEKKPIEWKDSDEKYLFWALLSIQKDIATSEINGVNTKDLNECVKWLYSLKQRIGG